MSGLAKELQLKVGARVMLLRNVCTEAGLFNGALGTVVGFHPHSAPTLRPIVGVPQLTLSFCTGALKCQQLHFFTEFKGPVAKVTVPRLGRWSGAPSWGPRTAPARLRSRRVYINCYRRIAVVNNGWMHLQGE